jgi:hypothetical protein
MASFWNSEGAVPWELPIQASLILPKWRVRLCWCGAVLCLAVAACNKLYAPLIALGDGQDSGNDGGRDSGTVIPCVGLEDGRRCDGGFCVNGSCLAGCWVTDAGGYLPASELFDDAGDGCLGCHPGASDTQITAVPEGTACGGYGYVGACFTNYGSRPEQCACDYAAARCPDDALANTDAGFVFVPCCGKCIGGHCCIASRAEQATGERCKLDSDCCDSGRCTMIDQAGYGFCAWDGGGAP